MGAEALEAAVFNWAQKRGVDLKSLGIDMHAEEMEEGRVVCKCFSMSAPYVRRKIQELGLKTIPEITNAIKAGGACMSCHHVPGGLQDLLNEAWGKSKGTVTTGSGTGPLDKETAEPAGTSALSPYQLGKQVDKAFEEYIRPMLKKDGGDVELVDIKDTLVYCRLKGACAGCKGAGQTLKMMIEKTLKDQVDERIRVIEV
jgi:NifU-like protein